MTMRPGQAKGPSTSNGSSSGGGGNVTGTFTATFLPIATGLHTLADGPLKFAAGVLKYLALIIIAADTADAADNMTVALCGGGAQAIGRGSYVALAGNESADNGSARIIAGNNTNAEIEIGVTANASPAFRLHNQSNTKTYLTVDATAGAETLTTGSRFAIGQSTELTPVALANVAGAVAINADSADLYTLTLAANATLSAPSNPRIGRRFLIRVRQDAVGGWTLAYNGAFRFPSGTAPTVSANTAQVTYLGFIWNEDDSTWDNCGLSQPFG